ncbi:MAG: AMP-binding protein [Armatimonadetes bacterium]|nr:AMP-binding protein [Armatimonadota bacterium]
MIRRQDFEGRLYEDARRAFRWRVPSPYNIGVDTCDRWAAQDPDRVAIRYESEGGATTACTYGALRDASNRLANALAAHGIGRGDRVAVILHQRVETAAAHIALYKMGAVAVPLTRMFGPDALAYRLEDSGSRAAVVDPTVVPKLVDLRDQLPALEMVIVVEGDRPPELPPGRRAGRCRYLTWEEVLGRASDRFSPVETGPDDSALIIYTSGTTGPPKGALHGHRMLLGHVPAFQLYFDFVPQGGEVYWTPADWAWIGGAYDLLFPGLRYGGPVVAYETTRFDPEKAFHLMAKCGVTHTFLPPTALKMAMQVERPSLRFALSLRAIMSGGEPVNPIILEWAARELPGVRLHEIYGQTEANLVCGNCSRLNPVRPGSLGKAFPGHEVTVLRDDGSLAAPGELGEIGVRGPGDPVVFKAYWQNPRATQEKYHGEWLLTGDMARRDDDGYFYFEGRKDDVINSAGYRIGPAEVESTLLTHPAVAEAAAVGVPDPVRGQIVKGFVKLRAGFAPSEALAAEIQNHVKSRLAAYAYPRTIEFLNDLPMTTTGKIRRAELRAREAARQPG